MEIFRHSRLTRLFGFQDVSTSEDREFNLHQLPDHGWHVTHDNDIGLGQGAQSTTEIARLPDLREGHHTAEL
jgi:hypothetical protein